MTSARSSEILPKEQLVCTPEACLYEHLSSPTVLQLSQALWSATFPQDAPASLLPGPGSKAPHLEILHLSMATGALPSRTGLVRCLSYAPDLYAVAQHHPRDP